MREHGFTVIEGGLSGQNSAPKPTTDIRGAFHDTHPYLTISQPSGIFKSPWETCPLIAPQVEFFQSAWLQGDNYFLLCKNPFGTFPMSLKENELKTNIQDYVFNFLRENKNTKILMALPVTKNFSDVLPKGLGHPPAQWEELEHTPVSAIDGITPENLRQTYISRNPHSHAWTDPQIG